MATETVDKGTNLARARQINEDRNKSRMDRLNAIADRSDEARDGEMEETADGNIVLKADDSKLPAKEPVEEPVVNTQILANATITPAEEEVVVEEPTEEVEEVVADATETVETVEEPEEELPTDERVSNGVRYYLTIVNGKERWLTKQQLITTAQKVESADDYLQTAAEAVRTVTRPDLSHKDETGSVEEDDDMEKTLSSAVLGDQEAVKKIASTFSRLQADLREAKKAQPSVTPDVVKEIDSRLSFRNAVDWFEGEYSKELSDPFLKKLIYDKDAVLSQEEPSLTYKARLKKAGDEVRTWINGQKGVQAKPSAAKVERKKTLVNVPAASLRQAVTTEDEEGEEAPEVTIAKMAQARGQRAIVHRGPLTK